MKTCENPLSIQLKEITQSFTLHAHRGGRQMTYEEMVIEVMSLKHSLKKANYRIYLLEKNKELKLKAKEYYSLKDGIKIEQLDLLEAIGG